ncbi:WD40-repeat-containing domain protein [Triangularia verruculosa]|uniref:Mitochondrial division protein 1 n=1 Tax=Triangularia verruculosa TaxID=2587418 RepID=A0AAN7ATP7_9PEZI|nr:WD40-repeat-containing domain protein [Triangularia verruculosa]
MWLLERDRQGGFRLTSNLPDNQLPPYAILSHTWLLDNEKEVTFQDLSSGATAQKKEAGYAKIQFCADQAAKDGLKHFWVDTCCINKQSSADLQEAITSMFTWYRTSARCYVYLADVSFVPGNQEAGDSDPRPWEIALRRSRWFRRGWTLQELLAPPSVEFFSCEGIRLGDKTTLEKCLHEVTGIPYQALRGESLTDFSVAERLSWAENRETTRKEDQAYCLLGIFNVFMPLMYGEGDYAFTRLRGKIDKRYAKTAAMDETLATVPFASEAAFNSFNNQHEPTCLPNTRSGLLQEIEQWVDSDDDKCIYWLSGIAGTGKSTVARTVARTCHKKGILGASFFFSKGGGDLSNATKFITTLALQLATRLPSTKRHIYEAIMRQKSIAEHSFRDQWDQLIIGPLSKLHKQSCPSAIVLVADALDECESERDIRVLLRVFATARSLSKFRLRIFLTSRPEIAIRHSLGKIPDAEREIFVLHEISTDIVNRDLSLYFESHFEAIREERDLDKDWPGKHIIARLVEISCGLFIWASTACRFIREGRRLTARRVTLLINGHRSGAGPEKQLDQIYTAVIRDSVSQDYNKQEKQEVYDILREVLGSIVVLSSPLSMVALSNLLNMPLSDIKETLADLHTIFQIPSQPSRPIRLHHPTFRDFLLDKSRCSELEFSVHEREAHQGLAKGCLRIMSRGLKRDICGLGSPGTQLKDIAPRRIEERIPDELQYACLYWVQHYQQSGLVLSDDDEVHAFFQKHFLHWVEAICLMGKSSEMGAIIRLYNSILEPSMNQRQLPFVKDARRLLFAFQNVIKHAPLQIYCAALTFVRPTNRLKDHFRSQIHPSIKKVCVTPADTPRVKDEFNFVNDLAFTPDGKQIASGSNTEIARLWNVASGAALWKFEGPTDKVSSVAISPDGTLIAAGSDDFTVMVWDLKTRALRYSLKAHSRWVNSVAFSPNGKVLASGSMDETVALWDVATGAELERVNNQSSCVNTAAFSPDGSLIATGSVDQMIRLWSVSNDLEELRMILDGHLGCVNSVRFSPDGRRLVSGSDDMTIKVWDTAAGTELISMNGHTKKVTAATYSLDSRLIVSGSEDMTVRVWDAITGTSVHILTGHRSGVNAVVFSPTGNLLASGSFNDDVLLWDAKDFSLHGELEDFDSVLDINSGSLGGMPDDNNCFTSNATIASNDKKGHSTPVTFVGFSPQGHFIATGSQDGILKLWDSNGDNRLVLSGHSSRINDVVFSPGSSLIASASADMSLRVWDMEDGSNLHTLSGHLGNVLHVVFSPDGKHLASCSADATARLWNPETGASLAVLNGHDGEVTDTVFSADGRYLSTCSTDATIIIWDVETHTRCITLTGHTAGVNSIRFSYQNCDLLVSSSEDATVRIWNWREGTSVDIAKAGVATTSASFSPDDVFVSFASENGVVELWDRQTQLLTGSFATGVGIRRVSFSNDGRYIQTDRGTLDRLSFPTTHSPTPHSFLPLTCPSASHTLFVAQDWVKHNLENFVWLPEDYHATTVAAYGGTIVMGHSSGALSVISAERS